MMHFITSSAKHLKIKAKSGKYSLSKYPCEEMIVSVLDNVKRKKITIIANVVPDANSILELMMLADGLKVKGAKKVSLIIPYLGYARQDKPEKGEAYAARIVCMMLKAAGVDEAYIIDAHNPKLKRFFRFNNIIPLKIFEKEFSRLKDPVIVAPDKGGIARAKLFAKATGCKTAFISKERVGAGKTKTLGLQGNVESRNAIIIDDMIDTGGTIIKAAEMLRENGAKDVYVAATHGLFSGEAISKLEKSPIKKIIVTNTLPVKARSRKLKVLRIEPLIERLMKKGK